MNRQMTTFLEYVAEDIVSRYGADLSRTAVVFPGKRAALFLSDYIARQAGAPLWSPVYMTISDLFRRQSSLTVADPIKLVGDLHKSYRAVTGSDETLDHFYGYGQIMAADFDDIDKSMADARKVLGSTESLKELDDTSYLSDEQRNAIRRFFGAFNDTDSELQRRFRNLWNSLYDIYADFIERLASQHLAYEGMLYRRVVTDGTARFDMDRYIFVGFNMLSKVEQTLFDILADDGKALFYWDYDDSYIDAEAGRFVKAYKERYGNALDGNNADIYAHFTEKKDITFVAAPTDDLQARFIAQWLRDDGARRICQGRRTAVVMCDEQLLPTAIHCVPDEAADMNITIGYPLAHTLYGSVTAMDCEARTLLATTVTRGDATEWLSRLVARLEHIARNNSLAKDNPLIAETLFRTYTICNRLKSLAKSGDIAVDIQTMKRLFREIVRTTSIPFRGEPATGVQLMGMLETRCTDFDSVLILSCNEGNMPRGAADTTFIPYTVRRAYGLPVNDHKTAAYSYYFHRLLQRARDITIAYNTATGNASRGEMSRYMLALLAESTHDIRRVTLRAGSAPAHRRTDTIAKSARVIELLRERFDASRHRNGTHGAGDIGKNDVRDGGTGGVGDDGRDACAALLSPTAINTYGECGLRFFYRYVAGIREPDADEGDVDPRAFGDVFHDAVMALYSRMAREGGGTVTKDAIGRMLSAKDCVSAAVERAFRRHVFPSSTNAPAYNGLQIININVIVSYINKLLRLDQRIAPFIIVGLERSVARRMTVKAGNDAFTTIIGGRIDRIDRVTLHDNNGQTRTLCRIIDYKTGARPIKTAPKSVDDIFDGKGDHPDYYLQTILYADIARRETETDGHEKGGEYIPHSGQEKNGDTLYGGQESHATGTAHGRQHDGAETKKRQKQAHTASSIVQAGDTVSPAIIFIQRAIGENYDPTLVIDKHPITDVAPLSRHFEERLTERVNEMFSPDIPFTRTHDEKHCSFCPYAALCGR